jgi:hypothetical protein
LGQFGFRGETIAGTQNTIKYQAFDLCGDPLKGPFRPYGVEQFIEFGHIFTSSVGLSDNQSMIIQ